MSLNLGKIVFDYLRNHAEHKFTGTQISEWILSSFPEECRIKKQNSQCINTDDELIQQLTAEISSRRPHLQKKHPELKITEERPRKYYYSEKSDDAEVAEVESTGTIHSINANDKKTGEQALYPLVSTYLWKEFGVYSKRIDEKRSSNKHGPNGNRWLHPDIVGMENLGSNWHPELRNCVEHCSDKLTKLWSFEVKLLINRSNARECFFQTVSNSSWANFAYLVAADINQDTIAELRMLSAAHGIGLIKLDIENHFDSQILIPAKERSGIDWNSANRLTTENKDFLKYIMLIKQFHQTGEIRHDDWDIPQEID